MRTVILRVVGLATLLLLVVASILTLRTMRQLPDTLVYFVEDTGSDFRLEAVGRRTGQRSAEERASAAVAELAAGPSPGERGRGLHSVVPAETRVLDVFLVDGILEVNLSDDFRGGGGSASMQGRLYQLFYTLSQPAEIQGVRLLIDDRPVTVFGGEGIILDSPWLRSEHPTLPVW